MDFWLLPRPDTVSVTSDRAAAVHAIFSVSYRTLLMTATRCQRLTAAARKWHCQSGNGSPQFEMCRFFDRSPDIELFSVKVARVYSVIGDINRADHCGGQVRDTCQSTPWRSSGGLRRCHRPGAPVGDWALCGCHNSSRSYVQPLWPVSAN